MRLLQLLFSAVLLLTSVNINARTTYNFNSGWLFNIGDTPEAINPDYNDSAWQRVTLPHAFNQQEAFRVSIELLTDTVAWYRKHFDLPALDGSKVFVEFEGVRQAGEFYINGHRLGLHENGVMAVGYDITPYVHQGENVIAVRIDNDWDYTERDTDTPWQWNNRNFNANYGGIPKNTYLHITPEIYQTLPLYSSLGTTGIYVYATDIDVPARKATINTSSEVRNESSAPVRLQCRTTVTGPDGTVKGSFTGKSQLLKPGETALLTASARLDSLNFWSWGYGYLYDVTTDIIDTNSGKTIDSATTRTGFRKTRFADGKVWLNDRVIQFHGYAQRTSNEWPAVGISIPAWLSDYSNRLMVESGGNLVRWMHVTPSKQDIESCDRVGLVQAMPAGDAEKDCDGRQWQQRVELMRDAIIYNRNNPSILFYESGNKGISEEHIADMIAVRDQYDPHGGRTLGCREMLASDLSEYGGEMLYINRSKDMPVWAMEYCRDEALRKYWDDFSWPYHQEGVGPLYRGKDASEYNHNQDMFAVELIRRWYDYWRERPGSGDRCSSGGAKIVFSDTNTHWRGAENYRRSGVTDPMRIPKDAFFAHQVMWGDTWVDTESHRSHIIGHWNYSDTTVKPVYVVSTADDVELLLNGHSLGHGNRSYDFLFTFPDVVWEAGTLEAVSRDASGKEVSRHSITTAGAPQRLLITPVGDHTAIKADGADIALFQVEVVDTDGHRCPLDNTEVTFTINGPAEWLGGIAQGPDNYILSRTLPVECGVNRVMVRSTELPGAISVTATADGLQPATIMLESVPVNVEGGLSADLPGRDLEGNLTLGPTPASPSYSDRLRTVNITSAQAGSNESDTSRSYDDNETTEWSSSDNLTDAWITYSLERPAAISDIALKLTGWRNNRYPLQVYAGDTIIWEGVTDRSLGYVHINPATPVVSDKYTLRLKGAASSAASTGVGELAGGKANQLESTGGKGTQKRLRIVEIEFLEPANNQ